MLLRRVGTTNAGTLGVLRSYSHSKECNRRIATKLAAAPDPTLAKNARAAHPSNAGTRLLDC
jgi:hypothetical protein